MKGQKQAVVEAVETLLPGFVRGSDVALVMLTKDQLEKVKWDIATDIVGGKIEYGKDASQINEVHAYARSMVMNHLKKAKELNGGQVYGKTTAQVAVVKQSKALSSIDMSLLPEDLSEFVKTLV